MIDYDIDSSLEEMYYILENEADFIIPVGRGGIRILELHHLFQKFFDEDRIVFYESMELHLEELRNKRIILFDEGVNSGKTLKDMMSKIASLNENKKLRLKIFSAALVVNSEATFYPDYYTRSSITNIDSYEFFLQDLNYRAISTGKPSDIDHLIIRISFEKESISELITVLQTYFNAIESSHSNVFDDVIMLTIDLDSPYTEKIFPFNIPIIDGFANLFEEGVKKIRCFIKENSMYIVPILYPCMEIDEKLLMLENKCPVYRLSEHTALCKIVKNTSDKDIVYKSTLCYNCVINRLNVYLVTCFLIRLRRYFNYVFKGSDNKYIQMVSHYEAKQINERNDKLISESLENKDIARIGKGKSRKCEFINVPYSSYMFNDFDFIDLKIEDEEIIEYQLPSEIEVAMVVNNASKDLNKSLLKYKAYSGNDPYPEGISYSQIYKLMDKVDRERISDGIDVAMDIGYLKPLMVFEGMEAISNNENLQVIVRLFAPTSENVSIPLKCFQNLIKKTQ